MPKLTKRLIESTHAQDKDLLLWDSELKGFLCKITPTNKKVYFLYYRTKGGRQRKPKIGDHGAITCEQARTIAQLWLAEVAQGKDPSGERNQLKHSPTLQDLAKRYMKEHAPRKKLSSQKEDQRLWQQHILPSLGNIKVASLTRDDIIKLQLTLRDLPTTSNRVQSLLSKALNLAELWGFRPDHSNPCRHIKKFSEQRRERFLSPPEISRLFNVMDEELSAGKEEPHVIYAIKLLLLTGCRLNEILCLQWSEVDLEKSCFHLSDSKTGKKTIYVSPDVIEVLNAMPQEAGNKFVILGKKKHSHLINLQKPWGRIRTKAGLEDVRIHDLRHTFASVAAASGLSLPIIGALLGHKQTQTTARYAHLVGQPLRDATEQISKKIIARKPNV